MGSNQEQCLFSCFTKPNIHISTCLLKTLQSAAMNQTFNITSHPLCKSLVNTYYLSTRKLMIYIYLVVGAVVTGKIGRRTSFEVVVNGKLIFSKLQSGGFPERREIISIVKDASGGAEPRKSTKSHSTCVIL